MNFDEKVLMLVEQSLSLSIHTKPTLLAIAVLIVTTLLYSTYEAESDGFTLIGFPLTFNKYTEGKIDPFDIGLAHMGFNTSNFLFDMLVLLLFIWGFNFIWTKYLKNNSI
ncbi:hypothetical protein ACUN24_06660 [Pedobacter sp. WC2501]|uniref:hypothetical protein n=1 Tax=Pedobacter sp. WC2501 TaxID=3461400 RepID=UPI00404659A5